MSTVIVHALPDWGQLDELLFRINTEAGEYGSRGLAFILNKNQLDVAVSRAKILAIIVGAPDIAFTSVNSSREMESMNQFCRLLDKSS